MQVESLKIVSNFFSCWEQPVGRKWSPEPLPFPTSFSSSFPTVIPLSGFASVFWFSTPLPLLTHLFLISPSFHSQEDNVHPWLQHEHNGDSVHSLVSYIPCPSQVRPSEGLRTPSPHPAKLQHCYSWFAIFLSFLGPRTSQHLQKPMDIPVLQVSESTTRSRASDIATEQRQKMPQTFSIPLWGRTAFLWKTVTILDYFLMCPVCTQSNLFSFFS